MTDNPALEAAREKSIAQEMIDVLNDSRKFVAKCAADHKGDGTQIAFFASRQCDRITSAIEKLEGHDEAISDLMAQAIRAVNRQEAAEKCVEALRQIQRISRQNRRHGELLDAIDASAAAALAAYEAATKATGGAA